MCYTQNYCFFKLKINYNFAKKKTLKISNVKSNGLKSYLYHLGKIELSFPEKYTKLIFKV